MMRISKKELKVYLLIIHQFYKYCLELWWHQEIGNKTGMKT